MSSEQLYKVRPGSSGSVLDSTTTPLSFPVEMIGRIRCVGHLKTQKETLLAATTDWRKINNRRKREDGLRFWKCCIRMRERERERPVKWVVSKWASIDPHGHWHFIIIIQKWPDTYWAVQIWSKWNWAVQIWSKSNFPPNCRPNMVKVTLCRPNMVKVKLGPDMVKVSSYFPPKTVQIWSK